jgi:hypothetical protein
MNGLADPRGERAAREAHDHFFEAGHSVARERFPQGWKELKPYLSIVELP